MHRFALLFIAFLASVSTASACGIERWPVKIGTDKDATKVVTTPKPTTIFDLSNIGEPSNPNIRKDTRYAPTELTTYQITATLSLIKFESDDHDYHLVIKDNRNRTMIVESPDPSCVRIPAIVISRSRRW